MCCSRPGLAGTVYVGGGAGTGAGDPLPTQMGPFGGPGGSALVSLKASVEAQCA